MGLESRYRDVFGKSIRELGHRLFIDNAVTVYEGGACRIGAEVRAHSGLHDVTLLCKDKKVEINCDCHEVAGKPCEHIWAVLLTAEKFNLFKDGAKRGVRLSGTASAETNEVPVLSDSKAIKDFVSPPLPGPVSREALYVINGFKSKYYNFVAVDVYWRPLNEKGPIKPLDPASSLEGLEHMERQTIRILQQFSLSPISLQLKFNENVLFQLKEICERQRLYSVLEKSQTKFKKINEWTVGEVELQASLESNSCYYLKLNFNGQSPDKLIFIGADGFISERGLFTLGNNKTQALFDYTERRGYKLNSWEVEEFLEEAVVPSEVRTEHLPGRLKCEYSQGQPQGHLFIRTALFKYRDKEQLHADLSFNYGGKIVPENTEQCRFLDFYNSRILSRNLATEAELKSTLKDLGFRFNQSSHKEEFGWKLLPSKLPEIVKTLLQKEWTVIAEGKTYRAPKSFNLVLMSGTDWFDLKGEVEYEGEVVPVAGLLKTVDKDNHYVQLGDGSFGILPEEWLKHYTVLTQLGEVAGNDLRFRKSQGLLIEKLLEGKLATDEGFAAWKKKLMEGDIQMSAVCSPAFKGQLRPYQQQGLAWLQSLEALSCGGILADDMGLGKTVQILALLQERSRRSQKPSLLLVPKSLIFNWQEEIQKFTSDLVTLVYTGASRHGAVDLFDEANIIITTYGTVRQDIGSLVNYSFDYCILDEAQVIKNRDSSTAKAVRLIDADYRISLSGTPVENSLSDLISQFEFLNPGMTAGGRLAALLEGAGGKLNKDILPSVRQAVRPFILRRTKQQVAKDLPEKIEQVIFCEMDVEQKKIYDQMLSWYRQELSREEQPQAGEKKKMDFLGALTRLRQLSCHPALVNEDWSGTASVKIELLVTKIRELISEGHRALIFSQFTSFLSLIKERLQEEKWSYCYLDGATKDRQEVVNSFQNNESIPLFLISLKAGGVGLNLTGADYVFIMDPWWNPAIENQAIDRAYRIGQKRNVYACRFICRDTVEEKVLKMQGEKQRLADSLVDESNSVIGKLTVEDFRRLLF